MIIGLTGKNGSGKGEVVNVLKSLNFQYQSLSDVLRDELTASGKPVTREALIQLGNDLRKKHGPAVLAEKILKRLEPDKNYVVDSIRNPNEAKVFKKHKEFTLVSIASRPELRFERLRTRGRESDPKTLEDFTVLEKREAAGDTYAQNLDSTISMSDLILENNGSLDELKAKVLEVIHYYFKLEIFAAYALVVLVNVPVHCAELQYLFVSCS